MSRPGLMLFVGLFLAAGSAAAQAGRQAVKTSDFRESAPPEIPAPVFAPPKLLEYAEAGYPKEAFAAGLEAEVVAELSVDENGLVVGVDIQKRAGHGFDEAAEAAMFRFVFAPATQDGAAIPSKVLYRYKFFIKEQPPAQVEQPPPAAKLKGTVGDMDGQPVPGASVVLTLTQAAPPSPAEGAQAAALPGSPPPATTDAVGVFDFEAILPGAYQVDVVAPGYKPFDAVEELVDGELREVIYRLEPEEAVYETVVRGRRPPREVTRREVTRREITRIPGTGGDALRSVQNLPGMARAMMSSGQLIIRGSSPEDSAYYFDQMPVPLLYHFGGLTSIINSDLLERIDYYPGNYGVRYGGATGGIVDVYPRAPFTDRWHAYVDADLWDIGALVEGPITEDWSIAASGRRSYIDAILGAVFPDDGGLSFTVAPRYYDYQLVVDYHPSPRDTVRFFGFGSDDKLVFVFGEDVADDPSFSGGVNFALMVHQAQLRWDHRFSKAVANHANIASGFQRTESSFGGDFQFDIDAVPVYLRDEVEIDAGGRLAVRTGLDCELYWAKWSVRAPNIQYTEGSTYDPLGINEEMAESVSEKTFYRPAWYGELEMRPLKALRLIPGVRIDYWSQVAALGVDPRFVVRYEVVDGTTLKGGIGLFHQAPSEEQTEEPFGNPDLKLIDAVHYSLGIEQRIIENLEVSLEGFYKDLSNLVVVSDRMTERDGELVAEQYNNDGVGRAYGMEVMLKQSPTDRLFGWISYTLMRSERVDHPGERERLFDYDQTHILTIVASVALGRGWEVGARFRLVSGNPDTPITGSVYDADSDIYWPFYGDVNSTRLPFFHQLDLRLDKKWTWKYLKFAVYLDVTNVYNQDNVEGYAYDYDYTTRQYFTGLPLIPSFGMKLEY